MPGARSWKQRTKRTAQRGKPSFKFVSKKQGSANIRSDSAIPDEVWKQLAKERLEREEKERLEREEKNK